MDNAVDTTRASDQALAGKYLTFRLADGEYGLEILRVREIIGLLPITSMPRTTAAVRGVINLRGRVIPVVDLRLRFGLPVAAATDKTCIIVVELGDEQGTSPVGVVVDMVSEVRDVAPEAIEPPPAIGTDVESEFIVGLAKLGAQVVILLDVEQVLGLGWPAAVELAAA